MPQIWDYSVESDGKPTLSQISKACSILPTFPTREEIAAYIGVLDKEFEAWMAKGAREASGHCADLFNGITEGEGKAKISILAEVRANKKSWQTASGLLARRYPDEFGSKSTRHRSYDDEERAAPRDLSEKVPPRLRWVGKRAYPQQTGKGGWIVRMRDYDGGDHSQWCKTEDEAIDFIEACRLSIAEESSIEKVSVDIGPFDGTLIWWTTALGRLASALVEVTDMSTKESIRKDLVAIGGASKSIKPLLDQGKLEKRMAEVEMQLSEVRAKRKHGAGTRGTFRRGRVGTRSSKSVSGSGV
tara:strand:- start:51 stop:953 length:903 start_codon:yes stop_codon:yes gene_type:complete